MTHHQNIPGPQNYPNDVIFEYANGSYIPVSAYLKNGAPYSGKACGNSEMAEWYGSYHIGLADGDFLFTLGNGQSGACKFVKGIKVEQTKI